MRTINKSINCNMLPSFSLFPCLTLYHTIPTFDNPKENEFGQRCGKRRKCLQPAFSPSPTMFSTLLKKEIVILAMLNLSSANAFNLVTSEILSFGKGLTLSKTTNFRLFQTERVCRLQFQV